MRQAVWKFPVPVGDHIEIIMPTGARVLTVQAQNDEPHIWAMCNPLAPLEPRRFQVLATGENTYSDLGPFVGTFQLNGGALVFHLFETSN